MMVVKVVWLDMLKVVVMTKRAFTQFTWLMFFMKVRALFTLMTMMKG
uniref:Uncharacterized protein n=1 Tax=Arundo donax TaxID=35708 RepID=A0A0A9BBW7_ARUDO